MLGGVRSVSSSAGAGTTRVGLGMISVDKRFSGFSIIECFAHFAAKEFLTCEYCGCWKLCSALEFQL